MSYKRHIVGVSIVYISIISSYLNKGRSRDNHNALFHPPIETESSGVLVFGMVALSLGIIVVALILIGCIVVVYNLYTGKTSLVSLSFLHKRSKESVLPITNKTDIMLCEDSQYVPSPFNDRGVLKSSAKKKDISSSMNPHEVTVSCYTQPQPPQDQAPGNALNHPPPVDNCKVQEGKPSNDEEADGKVKQDNPPDYTCIEDVSPACS